MLSSIGIQKSFLKPIDGKYKPLIIIQINMKNKSFKKTIFSKYLFNKK